MKSLLLFHLVLLLAGCAWLPKSGKRAEMISTPTMAHAMTTANAIFNVKKGWVQEQWWRQFNSPVLNTLIGTALKDNPSLKQVAARVEQAQTLVDAQAAEVYPTIDANISFSAQRFSANSIQAKLAGEHFRHLLINPFILRYHLDLWGQDEAALQSAIGKAHAVETELADAQLLLATTVAKVFVDFNIRSTQHDVSQQIVSYRTKLKAIAQSRLTNGLSSDEPLLKAEKALLQVQDRDTALQSQINRQKNLLAVLAGKGPDWGQTLVADLKFEAIHPQIPHSLPLQILSHRPDVQAAKMRAQAAADDIKVAQTEFYPDVNLVAFSGLHSVSISDVLLQGSSLAYAVGPSIDFPLFEGGRLRAQLSHQEAVYDEAVQKYNTTVLRSVQEVADAIEQMHELTTRQDEHQEILTTQRKSSQVAEALYREGLANRIDSLESAIEECEQASVLATLQGESSKALIQFYAALGGGYTHPPSNP
jgi:NodT family efflux transporter outer membrane factor (OMF) lipoprotein